MECLYRVWTCASKAVLNLCAASDEGGGGEQGGDHQTGGTGAGGAVPQGVVLQRCSLLQQSKSHRRAHSGVLDAIRRK